MATDIATLAIDVDSTRARAGFRQFERGAASAQRAATGLTTKVDRMRVALAGLGGIGATVAIQRLASLARTAISAADEIGEAATKIGIAGEALQRFRFAAAQADVGTEALDVALRMFAQNLASGKIVAHGNSLAEAFRNYLGSIERAPTQLEKVRLAQEAFGRQWQTAMLLAAQGANEFQRQADSAFVFSNKALGIASELDNTFRSLQNAVGVGFGTGFIEAFGGALDGTDDKLRKLNESAVAFGGAAATAFKLATQGLISFGSEIAANQKQTAAYFEAFQQFREGTMGLGDVASVLMDPREMMRRMSAIQQASDFSRGAMGGAKGGPALSDELGPLGTGLDAAKQEAEANRLLRERADLIRDLQTPWQEYEATLARIDKAHRQNAITAQEGAALQQQAGLTLASTYLGAVGSITGALTQLFEDSKELAIADAIINTLVGITKALSLPFPLNWAQAAAVSISGFAQVAKIKATKPGSGGSAGLSSAGRSSSGGGIGGGGADAQPQRAVFIELKGSSRFSRPEVEDLIGQLIDAQKDGAKLVLAKN